jgi:putative MFS transporter
MRAWATSIGSSWNRIGAVIAPSLIGFVLAAHLGIVSVFIMFGLASAAGALVIAVWGIETKQRTLEELAR